MAASAGIVSVGRATGEEHLRGVEKHRGEGVGVLVIEFRLGGAGDSVEKRDEPHDRLWTATMSTLKCSEQTVEVVRNREDGTRLARWHVLAKGISLR
jgi:hypothetical protein